MVGYEESLQTAREVPVYTRFVQFDELALGEFGVHPSLARRSRHFDQGSLLSQGYLRTVEDTGPYGYIFKPTYKPQFAAFCNRLTIR